MQLAQFLIFFKNPDPDKSWEHVLSISDQKTMLAAWKSGGNLWKYFFPVSFTTATRSRIRPTWATSQIWVRNSKTVGKKCWRHDGAMLAQIKCFCMLNVFQRGCSQLFPGTKILKIDSVAEENVRCEVGAVNTEEITSQICKFQSFIIGKPFVIVCRFRKMWLMHPDIARSNFTLNVLFGYWIFFQNFGTWE